MDLDNTFFENRSEFHPETAAFFYKSNLKIQVAHLGWVCQVILRYGHNGDTWPWLGKPYSEKQISAGERHQRMSPLQARPFSRRYKMKTYQYQYFERSPCLPWQCKLEESQEGRWQGDVLGGVSPRPLHYHQGLPHHGGDREQPQAQHSRRST